MNSLSWLIYFAGVVNSFSNVLLLVSIFMAIFIAVIWIARARCAINIEHRDMPTDTNPKGTPAFEMWEGTKKMSRQRWIYFTIVFLWIAVTLIPNQKTLYMIAASEAGEMIVTTPEAKDLFDGVHKVIKQNLNELIKEK